MNALVKCVLAHDFPYLAALILPFLDDKHRIDLIQVNTLISAVTDYCFYLPVFAPQKLGTLGTTAELAKKLQDKCQKYPYLGHIKSLIQVHL